MSNEKLDALEKIGKILNEDREREVPVILPTGEVIVIKTGDFDSLVATAEFLNRPVPMIPGMNVLFNHLERISDNLYVFYTDHNVVTSYDLTVVVINADGQILKKGTVSELCSTSDAFVHFMDNLYHDYSFAFSYPATIRDLFSKQKAPIMKPDVTDEWQPLLNGKKINIDDEGKGVVNRVLSDDELPQNTQGDKPELLIEWENYFSSNSKNKG